MMKKVLVPIVIFLLCGGLYAATVRGVPGNIEAPADYGKLTDPTGPFESSHERGPYMQFLSIKNGGRFDLTKEQADFATPDVGYYKGRFYSYFPFGVSLIMVPFYGLGAAYGFGQVAAFSSSALFSLVSLILLYLVAVQVLGLKRWAALATVLVFAFATTSWSYGVTIYQHSYTVFLMLLGFYAAWRYSRAAGLASFVWGSLVWASYAVSWFVDYPNTIILLPVMVYFLLVSLDFKKVPGSFRVSLRPVILLSFAVFLAITGAHFRYNAEHFGGALRFSNTLPRYETRNLGELEGADTEAISARKSQVVSIFREENVVKGIYELTVAPDKGAFFFSPILLLALLGLFYFRRLPRLEVGTVVGLAAVNIFLYSSFGDPWGGWAYGPRYIIPALAALSLLVGVGLSYSSWWSRVVTFLLGLYSVAIALLGALTTNMAPPEVEAVYLRMKYGFWYSLDFLEAGKSGSFLYNTYLSDRLSLSEYYLILYGAVVFAFLFVLFILPLFERHDAEPHPQS